MKIKKAAASLIVVAALTASTPAFAGEIDSATDGADAYTTGQKHYANIADIKADGHPVKAQYSYPYFADDVYNLWEKRGKGHANKSAYKRDQIWRIKACEYINQWPDDCSAWDSD
ncbi:hypothetical protein OG542_26500 [Streptomyces violaceus]|uniref:hypothetical protein n=1 Tax=Streptomyces violaceus TaxID=1936 RepID=UPI002E23F26D